LAPEEVSTKLQRILAHNKMENHLEILIPQLLALGSLKGLERRKKLIEIYHSKPEYKYIIQQRFGSLKKLADIYGIDHHIVDLKAYRDEADVHHDLDLIEKAGLCICFKYLWDEHRGLYNTISKTGWGRERLTR
jgi:hypothetical protein